MCSRPFQREKRRRPRSHRFAWMRSQNFLEFKAATIISFGKKRGTIHSAQKREKATGHASKRPEILKKKQN